jgi:hypothetical protein
MELYILKCEQCGFWRSKKPNRIYLLESENIGNCYRYPTVVKKLAGHWCGEHNKSFKRERRI